MTHMAGLGKAWHGGARQGRAGVFQQVYLAGLGWARHGTARLGRAGQGRGFSARSTGRGRAWPGEARRGRAGAFQQVYVAWRGAARLGAVGLGQAWRGRGFSAVLHGWAGHGTARHGGARRGKAGQGLFNKVYRARLGKAWRGSAWQGLAGQGVWSPDQQASGVQAPDWHAQQHKRHEHHRSTARHTERSATVEIKVTLTGVGPMLMHNERLANPLDPISRKMKEITSKRKKTDDDIDDLARLEFEGGLYWDEDTGPYLPSWNVKRSIQDGAKLNKLGRAIERSLTPLVRSCPLRYQGPRDVEGLYNGNYHDTRSVKVGTSKVSRTRPRFDVWAIELRCDLATEILNLAEFEQVARNAGLMVGIGDFRQRFGRYDVKVG